MMFRHQQLFIPSLESLSNYTKKMAETLLKDGKTYASGIFSEKTGKTYDAYIVLEDDGTKTAYRLEFERGKYPCL